MRKVVGPLVLAMLIASCTSSADPTTTSQGEPSTTSTAETTTTAQQHRDTTELLNDLGGEPCPNSAFTCVEITVPLDHFGTGTETTQVTFAVLPADGEPQGAFVTATGGPGSAGIAYADSYTDALDEGIPASYDIVFFDQRGTGMSGGLTCPRAAAVYYQVDPSTGLGFDRSGLTAAAEDFADGCVNEAGDSPLWPFLGTSQVVEDIETFRQVLDYDHLVLYGESYGTQVAQTYTAAHGDHVQRLVIDGVVDLTLTGLEYFVEQADAFASTLEASFDECLADEYCEGDFPDGDPGAEYDRLVALLTEEGLSADFPLSDGSSVTRTLSLGDLEVVAAGQMYGETDRMLFLRALAASAQRNDLVPMLRLLYLDLVVDPADETAIDDPSWSDAVYYGVECLDYNYPGDTSEERVEAFFANASELETARLGSVVLGDLPCAYWPHINPDPRRPEPMTAQGVPTLVLGATADPATPYHQGVDVAGRLADGHLMTQEGGPHVIFGRGNECPDVAVTAFILSGEQPSETGCDGYVVDYYPALFLDSVADYPDVQTFLFAIEDEVTYLPEYWYWDGLDETAAGCAHGGTLTMSPTDTGYRFVFDSCAFARDGAMTGEASYDYDTDVFTITDIAVGSDDCRFSYERSGEEVDVADVCDALFDPEG